MRVTRSALGVFELFTDPGFTYATAPTTSRGTLTDTTHSSSSHFGVFTRFGSASATRRVYLDNIVLPNSLVSAPLNTFIVGNFTSYAVTGAAPSTAYSYVVRATSDSSTSANSNEIDVTTTAPLNNLPSFSGMSVSTFKDGPVDILRAKILAKSSDADGDTVTISGVNAATAQAGSATLGATAITYNPASGFSGTDTITFSLSDGIGTVTHTIDVTVSEDPLFTSAGNVPTITDLPGGGKRIACFGIPGRTYAIQRSPDMAPGSWTQISAVTAAANSTVTFDDPTPPQPSAFYRIAFPAQ